MRTTGQEIMNASTRVAPGAHGSLILGIVGILMTPIMGGFIAGPLAIFMALYARQAIRDEPCLGGRKLANYGLFLGLLAIAADLLLLSILAAQRPT